jgi:CheY-like chemotaxis protein
MNTKTNDDSAITTAEKEMIESILLVDDENLFHLVFEDACSLLDITLTLETISSADDAEKLFKTKYKELSSRPACVFVDLNIVGSSFDGIELVRRINFEHGNSVVIGIISSSNEAEEQAKAVKAGAQFWIIKSDDIEPRLEEFKRDFHKYKNRTAAFKIYK